MTVPVGREISPSDNLFGDKQIKIVRHAGDLQSAFLEEDGTTVHRQTKIFLKDMGTFNCASYDNQFIFHHRFMKKGVPVRGWTLWCSCGSPAVVAGYDAYAKDASQSGAMIVCYLHATTGKHIGGMS